MLTKKQEKIDKEFNELICWSDYHCNTCEFKNSVFCNTPIDELTDSEWEAYEQTVITFKEKTYNEQ